MKEKIIKTISALNYLFDNIIRQDGMKHLIVGIVISSILKLFMPFSLALIIVTAILVSKELIYDDSMNEGSPELRDVFWGVIGMILGFI